MSRYPLFDPEFLNALERRESKAWNGVAWRVTVGQTLPLQSNSRGARWNPPGVDVLYASTDQATAIAEIEHLLSLQPIKVTAQRHLSRLDVTLSRLIDLSKPEYLEPLGWSVANLTGDDFRLPQLIGAAAEFLQVSGLLVPSARTTAANLVVLMKNQTSADVVSLVQTAPIPTESPIE